MNRYSAYLKRMARSALKGKYGLYIVSLIVIMLISGITESIPSSLFGTPTNVLLFISQLLVSFMLSVLVNMLNIGLTKLALSICRRQPFSFRDLFYAFTHQTDQFLILEIILTAIATLFQLPVLYLNYLVTQEILSYMTYNLIFWIWNFAAMFFTMLVTLWFALSVYLLIDMPELSPLMALRQSALLMRGLKRRLFYLQLSFTGMYLLGIVSCGIGFLWILPYQETAMAMFYLDVRHELS